MSGTLTDSKIKGGAWPRRLSVAATTIVLAAATVFFCAFVNRHYPIRNWLFWVYLDCWSASALFFLACVALGNACILQVLRRPLPLAEHLVTSFAIGAFGFFIAVFGAGLLGLIHPALFFAIPALFIAAGARPGYRLGRRTWRHLSAARRKPRPARSWVLVPLAIAGAFAVLLLYFPTLTPENIAYDVRWYHIPLAEHYVAEGAVRRFPEGWFFGAYPHLVSFYYVWALLAPMSYFGRLELAAHIEVVFFLVTLAGIPVLVRAILPRTRVPLAWVAVFLFPEIFSYDSSLHAGADHIAALWSIPIFTALLRSLRTRSPVFFGLAALMMAASINTKFTAATVAFLPACVLVAASLAWLVVPPRGSSRRSVVSCLVTAAVVGLIGTAPFWLKNWVFYGDPLYPKFSNVFRLRPYTPDFQIPLDYWFYPPDYHPPRNLDGLKETLLALVDFSFKPRDWPTFHGDSPIFGSVFTLLLACVPFLGRRPRLWLLIASAHAGVFLWYSVHHFDRYLQTLVPWMAASIVVCFVLVWRMHWAPRPFLLGLVAAQLVWGGDVYFYSHHAMAGSALKRAIDLMAAGSDGNYKDRFKLGDSYAPMAKAIPKDAKVLVHEIHVHWGLERMSVSDWQGSQGGISYVRTGSPAGVHRLLSSMGVTHVVWERNSRRGDTLGSDLLFYAFARYVAKGAEGYGNQTMARMPLSPPAEGAFGDLVAMFDCGGRYDDGLYRITSLTKSDFDPDRRYPSPDVDSGDGKDEVLAASWIERATYAVVERSCHANVPDLVGRAGFTSIARRDPLELYVRPPKGD